MDSFDLKKFRAEKLKITQAQMAQTIGIRQDALSRYEDSPEDIPARVLLSICDKYGVTLDQMFDYQKETPCGLEIVNNWSKMKYLRESVSGYLMSVLESASDENANALKEFLTSTYRLTTKPKVVLLGRSDSGKSTMINALLGENKLPTSWTPVTSIIVYIKHVDDRPEFITDELWVFGKDEQGRDWDDARLQDQAYTTSHKIAGGNAELLSLYGTGTGKKYQELAEAIGSAILFVDSPILKNCDILDVPGFTGGRPCDVKAAEIASRKADILIYLSQANSFMSIDDAVYLKGGVENLPVFEQSELCGIPLLSNLFVVATQAHIINHGNKEEVKKILDYGAKRFFNTLPEEFWNERSQSSGCVYAEEDVRRRFFSYTVDIAELRSEFEQSLTQTIEQLPLVLFANRNDMLKKNKQQLLSDVESRISYEQGLLGKRDELAAEWVRRNAEKNSILFELREHRRDLIREIEKCRQRAWTSFEKKYRDLICETELVELMKIRDIKNKKASKEEFLAYLSSKLDKIYKDILLAESKTLASKLERYTESCQKFFNTVDVFSDGDYKNACVNLYSTRRAFIAGASGVATFGALAVWASTLGSLGGYIIVAKAVSLLAGLGIHVGGTAAAVSTVAALGGPVAWGLALATVLGLAIFGIMGGGWKKQFAQSICKEMDKRKALADFKTANDKYWRETLIAFEAGANEIERSWEEQTKDLHDRVANYDADLIKDNIRKAEEMKQIVVDIPLA